MTHAAARWQYAKATMRRCSDATRCASEQRRALHFDTRPIEAPLERAAGPDGSCGAARLFNQARQRRLKTLAHVG